MGMEYRNGSHTKYKIGYHFVWVTKYRYRVLMGDVGLRVRELDHAHLLVSAPPNISPSAIMRRIKGRTSTKLFQEFPQLNKRYWGQHF